MTGSSKEMLLSINHNVDNRIGLLADKITQITLVVYVSQFQYEYVNTGGNQQKKDGSQVNCVRKQII